MPIVSPRFMLMYLDTAEDGSTHAIFEAAPGDINEHKVFSANTPSHTAQMTFAPGHPAPVELEVGKVYAFDVRAA